MVFTAPRAPRPGPVFRAAPVGATRFGPVTETETHHLSAPTLAEAFADVLRSRGAHVSSVDTRDSDDPDDHEVAILLVSCPDETDPTTSTAAPTTVSGTGAGESRQAAMRGGMWRMWAITREDDAAWCNADPALYTTVNLLDDALLYLNRPQSNPHSFEDYLAGTAWPSSIAPLWVNASRQAALSFWWETRMSEGHTPGPEGSAHLLLALTLPPTLMGALTYTTDGTPTLAAIPSGAALPVPAT